MECVIEKNMATKFLFLFLFFLGTHANRYSLQKVLMLSRHNIRTPLARNLETLTPKTWPKWSEDFGHLTPKGALLEEYMGEYFSEWLKKEELLSRECPLDDQVYVYANAPQRTIKTAESFTKSAFQDCNVTVHYKKAVRMDPLFNPIVHNSTNSFKKIVLKEMQKKLDELDLDDKYLELNRILDIEHSEICKSNSVCDLAKDTNDIFYEIGEEPNVKGALAIGNSVVDYFLMGYYDGMPLDSIGWGELSLDQMKSLTQITKDIQNIRFNSSNVAQDVAKPLLDFMFDKLLNETVKFTLLVGHDSNLYPVMTAMGFKHYELPNQNEKTPIGGKLVFQMWHDEELNRDLLKINYVYQTIDQLRNGVKLSLKQPPNSVVMELKNCKIDENGFCLWEDFVKLMKSLQ